MTVPMSRRFVRTLIVLVTVLALFRLVCMAWLPLMDTTEARYGEIARKMLASGDWITPWQDDQPFWAKPPLAFWLSASSMGIFGIHEFAARLPHWLCLVGVIVLTAQLARRRSSDEALLSMALLSAAALYFVSAGAVMTDAALVVSTTLAMSGFWRQLHEGRGQWQFFLGLGLGLLAKGPLVLVLTGLPLVAWSLAMGRFGAALRAFKWGRGLLEVLVIAVPWYLAAEQKTPGFLEYFLVGEHWHRFVTPGWKGDLYGVAHRVPIGMIWLYAVLATLPWALVLPMAALSWRRDTAPVIDADERAWRWYLGAWSLAPLIFFTPARNIIWTYVLPAMPAMALLAAAWLTRVAQRDLMQRWVVAGLALTVPAFGVAVVVALRTHSIDQQSAKSLVAVWRSQRHQGEPLIFVGSRLHSASFYSEGQAQLVADCDAARVRIGSRARGFVAVEAKQALMADELRASGARDVGRFGRYELFETAGAAASASSVHARATTP